MPSDPWVLHDNSSANAIKKDSSSGLALYIHWPFCISKCPYCDFNSHIRASVDYDAWLTALTFDLRHEHLVNGGPPLSSIFFGGGTPSLMPPRLVAKLVGEAANLWGLASGCEITLEANPSSVEAANFHALASAGVNRVSLGLQALDDQTLQFLGRAHDTSEGLAALDLAQDAFERVSFDLIYARPGQSAKDWQTELTRALAFGTNHLSLYQLTIESGTRFETLVRTGELIPVDDDHCADLFELTQQITGAAGLPAYEISNHARPGEESRHNLTYWRYDDYIGIGPGAHGRRLGMATERHKKPENYLSAVDRNGHGIKVEQTLAPQTRVVEALMMGLRLSKGVDLSVLEQKTGMACANMINELAVERLSGLKLVTYNNERLIVTSNGLPLLDGILPEIITL